jgi:hypothetical protein
MSRKREIRIGNLMENSQAGNSKGKHVKLWLKIAWGNFILRHVWSWKQDTQED